MSQLCLCAIEIVRTHFGVHMRLGPDPDWSLSVLSVTVINLHEIGFRLKFAYAYF